MPDLSSPLAQPFFFPEGEHAVLLMHGFTGSPAHMRKLGEALHARGFAVRGILLPGHGGVPEDMIHAIVSHGYGLCVDVKPEHEMEKVLFACDELTGLIGAAALMRPSKSVQDMELKSLKKKFKDKRFAAGCDRDVIIQGAEMLGWDLDKLLSETLEAMKTCEEPQ